MKDFSFTSVEDIPGYRARAMFTVNSASVFRDDVATVPMRVADGLEIMPWGADNMLPFNILDLIEKDETLATCQVFNAEVCYGAGLSYDCCESTVAVKDEVETFFADNDMPAYFLGACQDLKHFGFCVSVIVLNNAGTKVVKIARKEACYCRFTPANRSGRIESVAYANWRMPVGENNPVEVIPLLNPASPFSDLRERVGKPRAGRKFAVMTRIPTPDSLYYPIPYYGALFRGKWYNIKQIIGAAKEAKLKNTAPIKYHIEIAQKYWENLFRREGITDRTKQLERMVKEKENILNFLTGAENSGKVLFSTFYVAPTGEQQNEVRISRIETGKEGGDWETDIQEAINMICFTMRVHSNLVGSVPGKAQSNNSGSDKRELYTIAQALQKPYHDILFRVHQIIIRFNNWGKVFPVCPFIQLTTLDEHRDSKQVIISHNGTDNSDN